MGEVVGQQPGRAEAIGERRPGQRGEIAERSDPEPVEAVGKGRGLVPEAQQCDGLGVQFGRPCDDRRAPRARADGGGERAEARRSGPDPGRAAQGAAHRRDDAVERAAVQAAKAARVEAGEPGTVGLDRRADRLECPDDPLPRVGDPDRVGRHERQTRAARERLAQAHPGMDAERLGRVRDLADELLAARLRCEGGRPLQERLAPAGGDGELESWKHYADD